jgi:hypothetical protein
MRKLFLSKCLVAGCIAREPERWNKSRFVGRVKRRRRLPGKMQLLFVFVSPLHRLGGKPFPKEGGMLRTLFLVRQLKAIP